MIVLKCKMCGGDIQVNVEQNYGTCNYCGGTMTLPSVSDERRANLFNRANHFRIQNEFDKALTAYENILNEDNSDAEAHWGLTLCRYGIEYVNDPLSHNRVPTCHRVQYESILTDPDYLEALEHAPDGYTRSLYSREAEVINEIQKGILAISQNEEPFDVFICYKETADSGSRTKDSTMAQDVYYQLTQSGYKVFFSRITLEDKLGSAYEPYIFSALNSARVMVVIGTSAEHFNAVWVKNEWSRYLTLMKKDRSRLLIPCYHGMDPYDLPEELSFLQSQDMSKIGFIQDLIRGIQKVIKTAKPEDSQPARDTADEEALLKRARLFLEDGDFESADKYCERVLDMNPECARAYMGKYLAANKFSSEGEIVPHYVAVFKELVKKPPEANLRSFMKEVPVEPDEESRKAIDAFRSNNILDSKEISTALSFNTSYIPPEFVFDDVEKRFTFPEADLNFKRAQDYTADAGQYSAYTERIRAEIESFRDAKCREDIVVREIQERYARHISTAVALLRSKEQEWSKKRKMEKNRLKRKFKIYFAVAALLLICFYLIYKEIKNSAAYDLAAAAFERGDYIAAADGFRALGNYEDAGTRVNETMKAAYDLADAAFVKGDYITAADRFRVLGNYEDAEARVSETMKAAYDFADAASAKGSYESAINIFTTLANFSYKDSYTKLLETRYAFAEDAFAKGDYKTAGDGFKSLDNYKDSRAKKNMSYDAAMYAAIKEKTGRTYTKRDIASGVLDNVLAIGHGNLSFAGLRADGKVVTAGSNSQGQCNVSDWENIIAVAAGSDYTVGLRADGTVVLTGKTTENNQWEMDVSGWRDIIAVAAGDQHIAGLRSDGTVVLTGNTTARYQQKIDVSGWKDVIAVGAGGDSVIGLRSDGTVVVTGGNITLDVSEWKNIIAVSTAIFHVVGLRSDGTVVWTGMNFGGFDKVSGWKDIVAVSSSHKNIAGLRADGTVVVANDILGVKNLNQWSDIVAVKELNEDLIVGLRADGTVVTDGYGTNDRLKSELNLWNIDWRQIAIDNAYRIRTPNFK